MRLMKRMAKIIQQDMRMKRRAGSEKVEKIKKLYEQAEKDSEYDEYPYSDRKEDEYYELLDSLSEDEQIELINWNVNLIMPWDVDSEEVQLAMVNKRPELIFNMRNPSEKVQMAVVEIDPHKALKYIQYPSEKVQMALVDATELLPKNASETVKKYLLDKMLNK